MLTINAENFANRRMHHLKIIQEGRELSIHVLYFPSSPSAKCALVHNKTFLGFYPKPSVVLRSGDRHELNLAAAFGC